MLILAVLCAAGAADAARPDDGKPTPRLSSWWVWQKGDRPPNPWIIQVEPTLWYVAPSGDIELPGGGSMGIAQATFDTLNLDSPRATPAGEVHLRVDGWRFSVGGMTFETEGRRAVAPRDAQIGKAVVFANDTTESSLMFSTLQGTIGHRIGEARLGAADWGGHELIANLEGFVGLRGYFVDLSISVDRAGPSTMPPAADHADEHFFEPFIGVRLDVDLHENFSIDLAPEIGYWPSDDNDVWSWAMSVGFQWRPVPHLGVQIGFRQHGFELISGSGDDRFRWRGGVGGVYAGLALKF